MRRSNLADIGMSTCENCGKLFIPVYPDSPMIDPRSYPGVSKNLPTMQGGIKMSLYGMSSQPCVHRRRTSDKIEEHKKIVKHRR